MTNEMWAYLIGAGGACAGAIILGVFTLISGRTEIKKNDFKDLCSQVEAYYVAVGLLCDEIAPLDPTHRASVTIMKDNRKVVSKKNYERPDMTPSYVRKIRKKYRL